MSLPRLFHLQRNTDVTGASGTGRVAEGCMWPDGSASVWWHGEAKSVVYWPRFAHAKRVHGHGGATEFVWPADLSDRLARIAGAHAKDIGEAGLTSGCCSECGYSWPCPTYVWATEDRDPNACWDPADDDGGAA